MLYILISTIIVTAGAIYIARLVINYKKDNNRRNEQKEYAKMVYPLRVSAYERLVLMLSRIEIGNLLAECNDGNLTVIELHSRLISKIRQEFNYNTSQQIFVSQVAWEMVSNIKETVLQQINVISSDISPREDANILSQKLLTDESSEKLRNSLLNTVNFLKKELADLYW
ncbi:MAG: hypothetical protein WBH98_05520 [Bacteroidales bacterium]